MRLSSGVLSGESVQCFFLLITGTLCAHAYSNGQRGGRTVRNLVQGQGYHFEEHYVTTEDGYILLVHRVPFSPKEADRQNSADETRKRPVVLIAHGAFTSSGIFLIGNSTNSIGYALADNGFDVWLLNYRGNIHSRNHTSMNPDSPNFWYFSFDEMALYDNPAVIDYIIELTGVSKLNYIGYSMGTTAFFITMATKLEYNSKINHMIAWAPAVFVSNHINYLYRILAVYSNQIQTLFSFLRGTFEFVPYDGPIATMYRHIYSTYPWLWMLVYEYTLGGDSQYFDHSVMDALLSCVPVSLSSKAAVHYAQFVNTGEFKGYDEGSLGNLNRYGQFHPPLYNLTKVTAPVTLFEAKDDSFGRNENLDRLEKVLPNLLERFMIKRRSFGHMSVLVERDAYEQVLLPTIIRLMKYNSINRLPFIIK